MCYKIDICVFLRMYDFFNIIMEKENEEKSCMKENLHILLIIYKLLLFNIIYNISKNDQYFSIYYKK